MWPLIVHLQDTHVTLGVLNILLEMFLREEFWFNSSETWSPVSVGTQGAARKVKFSPSAGRKSACKTPKRNVQSSTSQAFGSCHQLRISCKSPPRARVSRLTCEPIDCASRRCAADELITTPRLAHYLYDDMC